MENLAKALVKAQNQLHNLGKNADGHNYQYLTLDKLIDNTRGVLAECGLAIAQPMADVNGEAAVKTILIHESGEMIEGIYPIAKAGMRACNDAQQMGAAITYGRRYSLAAMLNIAQADDDGACIGTGKPQPQPVHDEFKAKAEALLDKYSGQIAQDKEYSAWVDACVADGYWKDLHNNMAQRFGK